MEIAAVEDLSGRNGHFTVEFGFDPYRNKDALDVLVVGYDSAFGSGDGYVQAAVRIEGGARPDPVPVEAREIVPYMADELPNGADLKFGGVTTVKPERTFWEKVLILHAMTEMTEKRAADNDPGRTVPDLNRYSRHYYDVHQNWRHSEYGGRQPQCVIWPKHAVSTSSSCFVRLITDTNGSADENARAIQVMMIKLAAAGTPRGIARASQLDNLIGIRCADFIHCPAGVAMQR